MYALRYDKKTKLFKSSVPLYQCKALLFSLLYDDSVFRNNVNRRYVLIYYQYSFEQKFLVLCKQNALKLTGSLCALSNISFNLTLLYGVLCWVVPFKCGF